MESAQIQTWVAIRPTLGRVKIFRRVCSR